MIGIRNFTSQKISEEFLERVIKEVLREEGINGEVELSVAILGPGRMREVNKRYRGKNRITDVLSFPETEIVFQNLKIGPKKKIKGLGEILICPRAVKKNAKRFNVSFEEELKKVLIHGVLHLLGYNHEQPEDEKRMREKEENYLLKIK